MTVQEVSVSTLSEYVDTVRESTKSDQTIFRGQPAEHQLLPRIGRGKNTIGLKKEMELTEELELRSPPLLKRLPAKEWEWMALAQHFGLATRLLDWTRYALAALWFAVCEQTQKQTADAAVWAFRYEKNDVNKAEKGKKEEIYGNIDKERRTQVLFTRHIDRRMVAQAACFTVHARDRNQDFIALDAEREKEEGNKRSLTKIIIRQDRFRYTEFRRQLNLLGINKSVLFPNLEGLCSHIAYSRTVES